MLVMVDQASNPEVRKKKIEQKKKNEYLGDGKDLGGFEVNN